MHALESAAAASLPRTHCRDIACTGSRNHGHFRLVCTHARQRIHTDVHKPELGSHIQSLDPATRVHECPHVPTRMPNQSDCTPSLSSAPKRTYAHSRFNTAAHATTVIDGHATSCCMRAQRATQRRYPVLSGNKFANTNRDTSGERTAKPVPAGSAPLQLYTLATPNGQKVGILLEV